MILKIAPDNKIEWLKNEKIAPNFDTKEQFYQAYKDHKIEKINSYLKEIADITGIRKPLCHKVARKTFGSLLLYHDVPMKIVSELMGHSSVLITERHYAKLELKKLGETIIGVDLLLNSSVKSDNGI